MKAMAERRPEPAGARPPAIDARALGLGLTALAALWQAGFAAGELMGYGILCVRLLDEILFLCFASASVILLVPMFLLRRSRARYAAYGLECLVYFAYLACFPYSQHGLAWLIICLILPVCAYEAFPRGLWLSAAGSFLFFVLRSLLPSVSTAAPLSFDEATTFLVIPPVVSLLAGFLFAYRREAEEARGRMLELARLNLSYQDYSATVAEKSALEERRRISRDIHDTVGYALTNAIMMMEAASLMAGKEPDKVAEFMERARSGTEKALSDVREALRGLRRDDELRFSGPVAISRTVRVFRLATKTDVELDFGNFSWELDEERATIAYHFIQEGMLNAFSHGKASLIRVSLRVEGGELVISIRDNGRGAEKLEEGIGIKGARERLARVGGSLEYRNVMDGFLISLRMPGASP